MPPVSVIAPNINPAPFLQQQTDSSLNQTSQNHELFLPDDYSTDNSPDLQKWAGNTPH